MNNKKLTIISTILLFSFNLSAKYYKEINSLKQYNSACKSSKPVVIMYSSPTCQPCKKTEPNFDRAAKEFPQVEFFKLDLSKPDLNCLIEKNKVRSVPVFSYLKNGKECKRDRRGAMTFQELNTSVNSFLSSIEPKKSTKSIK